MRSILLTAVLIVFSLLAFSQQIIYKNAYCEALKDTVRYRVWLPAGYQTTTKYPVFYTMEETEDGLLAGGISLYKNAKLIPDAIVIGVQKGRSLIGFDFKSGYPGEKGLQFLSFLTTSIMPDIDKSYSTAPFKVFMGHSLSSTYGNYLFLHRPGLFNAYLLFAPERWWIDETRPPFELDAAALQYYNTHPCFYFLASGSLDEPRRRAYAKEIAGKLSQLDSAHFFFQFTSLTGSDHISIVGNALTDGIGHIFKPYYQMNIQDSVADPLAFFIKTKRELAEIYGLPLERNNNNSMIFSGLAAASKDRRALDSIAAYFIDEHTRGLDLANFGYNYLAMGDLSNARYYYERSIAKTEQDELETKQGPANLIMAYRALSYRVYADDNAKAWTVLEQALKDGHVKERSMIDFYLGKLAADRGYRTKEGVTHLLRYMSGSGMEANASTWGILPGMVYFNLAKCYADLKDKVNARLYAGKALTEDPKDKNARALLDKL